MQDNEILILEELEKNSNITQRDLSEKTGLSLGMVNLLLKSSSKRVCQIRKVKQQEFQVHTNPRRIQRKEQKDNRVHENIL